VLENGTYYQFILLFNKESFRLEELFKRLLKRIVEDSINPRLRIA
jgi:hypothetical protein